VLAEFAPELRVAYGTPDGLRATTLRALLPESFALRPVVE